jgi:adenosylmethionine-8-amino-7-oxononanoate aminotransferase
VMPPLAVTDDEIDILCQILAESIRRLAAERPGGGS